MKRSVCLIIGFSMVFSFLPLVAAHAQTKGKSSLPQVPITYAGDTNETIMRRAQWIEGAKKEGNTLTWWSVGSAAERKEIIAAFNKVYPAIKVDYWRGEGEEIGTKLELEFNAKRHTVDVAYGGEPVNFPRWRKMGMLEKFLDLIPGIAKWDKRYYGVSGDTAQPGASAITPQYNTKLVSAAEAPKSWEDLLHPKWKGQLGTPTDVKTWWTLALAEGGWGVEKMMDFVTKLKAQQPKMQTGLSQGHALLIAGDFKIYTNDFLRRVVLSQEKGAAVDWCRVNPVVLMGPNLFMPTQAPHPNSVRLFVEWFLSPEGMRVNEQVTGYGFATPGSGSRLSEIVKGHTSAVRTEDVVIKAVELDLETKLREMLM